MNKCSFEYTSKLNWRPWFMINLISQTKIHSSYSDVFQLLCKYNINFYSSFFRFCVRYTDKVTFLENFSLMSSTNFQFIYFVLYIFCSFLNRLLRLYTTFRHLCTLKLTMTDFKCFLFSFTKLSLITTNINLKCVQETSFPTSISSLTKIKNEDKQQSIEKLVCDI